MTELANTGKEELSLLGGLALQAKTLAQSAAMNMLQLGRVLCEAKPLVPHGEWDAWIRDNAYMKRRTAETYMQAYKTFGLNAKIAELGTTKVMKLLPMNEEEREELLAEHDVSAMSTRQLDEAIRQQKEKLIQEARAEVQEEIERERKARIAAEQRAITAENKPPEPSQEVEARIKAVMEETRAEAQKEIDREREARIAAEQRAITAESRSSEPSPETEARIKALMEKAEAQKEFVDNLSRRADEVDSAYKKARQENEKLRQEIMERDELIEEQQEEYNRTQAELLSVKSSIAKGDAERMPVDRLTPDAFATAVRAFVGTCARLPHMAAALSAMEHEERREYDELLRTVESWAKESRKAIDAVIVEGMVTENV